MPAPTNEIAIGRKIIDLAIDSVRLSLSASTAKPRPMDTAAAGTTKIQNSVLRSDRSIAASVKT